MLNANTLIGKLRLTGFAEAISWLALLGIAMPLKYFAGKPLMVTYVGWVHGLLFIAYIIMLYLVKVKYNWSWKKAFTGGIAAFLPFGTLVFDRQLRSPA